MQAPATTSPELVFSGNPRLRRRRDPTGRRAFTLVELLIVIAIIGIIAAMVISSYSNAAQDTRNVVVLQQQAEVQGALNNWIARLPLAEAKSRYNDVDAHTSNVERIELIHDYLDDTTLAQFKEDGSWRVNDGQLVSDVMERVGQSLYFSDWESGSYPKVILNK